MAFRNVLEEIRRVKLQRVSDQGEINLSLLEEYVEKLERINLENIDAYFLARNTSESETSFVDYINTLIKVADFGAKAIDKCVPYLGTIIRVITAVASFIFGRDIAKVVAREFREVLDEQFMIECWATSSIFKNCVRYLKGLPASQTVTAEHRDLFMARLSSDCPINTGLKEIAILDRQIQLLVKQESFGDISVLMDKAQAYCCLTTFREYFLMVRYVVEHEYQLDTQSTLNVLEGQRADDAILLKFLYKPDQSTFCFNFSQGKWPLVAEFLNKRGLRPHDTTALDGKTVRIWSTVYPDSCLSFHTACSCIRCSRQTEGQENENTLFLLKRKPDTGNVFTIHPVSGSYPDCTVYHHDWMSWGRNASDQLKEWIFVKLDDEDVNEKPSYVFLLKSEDNVCLFEDYTGRVYGWGRWYKSDKKCFWKIKEVQQDTKDAERESTFLDIVSGECR